MDFYQYEREARADGSIQTFVERVQSELSNAMSSGQLQNSSSPAAPKGGK